MSGPFMEDLTYKFYMSMPKNEVDDPYEFIRDFFTLIMDDFDDLLLQNLEYIKRYKETGGDLDRMSLCDDQLCGHKHIENEDSIDWAAVPSPKELAKILQPDVSGQKMTGLMVAAKYDRPTTAKIILEECEPDLSQEGTVIIENHTIEGASALWCAAGAGHLRMVELLVDAGADVNQTTSIKSTPLRAACFRGSLPIVEFLVSRGANFNIANQYDNTCLMIAGYKGHADIVEFLLSAGAKPDVAARCGASVLHFSAEGGHTEVVSALASHGATLTRNEAGFTALVMAAERCQADVVDLILSLWSKDISREEKIDALELIGASFANDKESYNAKRACEYLLLGMEERWRDPENPIRKKPLAPVEAYGSWVECETVEQVKSRLEGDLGALYMEGLTIRERLLGADFVDIPRSVIYRGAVYADSSRFDRCVPLWLHALRLKQKIGSPVQNDLLRFAQVFSQILHIGKDIEFSEIGEVLKAARYTIQQNMDTLDEGVEDRNALEEELKENINTFLYLIVIFTKIKKSNSSNDRFEAMKTIYQVVRLNPRYRNGCTLLHLCVDSSTSVDTFHTSEIVRFPCALAAKLLVEAGADVEAMDNERNTPLHRIVAYKRVVHDFASLHAIISLLIESGAHDDCVNVDGFTPFECAETTVAQIILKTQRKLSLKCLAAQSVKKHRLTYQGHVPVQLEKFIELHGL